MDHAFRGESLTRRAVLRLMAAAAARPAPASASPAPLARPIPSSGETIPAVGLGTWRTFDVGASPTERAPLRDVLKDFAELGGRSEERRVGKECGSRRARCHTKTTRKR